jgi:hypothetical protein
MPALGTSIWLAGRSLTAISGGWCWDGGVLASGDAVRIRLGPPVALGNSGGLITLLDPDGLKVDGVAYTKAQADAEGWSLILSSGHGARGRWQSDDAAGWAAR